MFFSSSSTIRYLRLVGLIKSIEDFALTVQSELRANSSQMNAKMMQYGDYHQLGLHDLRCLDKSKGF